MKFKGEFPKEIALAREILVSDTEEKGHYPLDKDTDAYILPDPEAGFWQIWVDGEPVDVINPDGFASARKLADYLANYSQTGLPRPDTNRRGFQ